MNPGRLKTFRRLSVRPLCSSLVVERHIQCVVSPQALVTVLDVCRASPRVYGFAHPVAACSVGLRTLVLGTRLEGAAAGCAGQASAFPPCLLYSEGTPPSDN